MSIPVTRVFTNNHYIYSISNSIIVVFNLDNTINLNLSNNLINSNLQSNIKINDVPKYFNSKILNLVGYIVTVHLLLTQH